jgi:hypothetical protein
MGLSGTSFPVPLFACAAKPNWKLGSIELMEVLNLNAMICFCASVTSLWTLWTSMFESMMAVLVQTVSAAALTADALAAAAGRNEALSTKATPAAR